MSCSILLWTTLIKAQRELLVNQCFSAWPVMWKLLICFETSSDSRLPSGCEHSRMRGTQMFCRMRDPSGAAGKSIFIYPVTKFSLSAKLPDKKKNQWIIHIQGKRNTEGLWTRNWDLIVWGEAVERFFFTKMEKNSDGLVYLGGCALWQEKLHCLLFLWGKNPESQHSRNCSINNMFLIK